MAEAFSLTRIFQLNAKVLFRGKFVMRDGKVFLYMFCLLFVSAPIHSGIILISVPKCGTHLAIACIKAITGFSFSFSKHSGRSWISFESEDLKAPFLARHAIYSPEHDQLIKQHKSIGILILRDPRDQCISWYAFLANQNPDIWPGLPLNNFKDFISTWIQDTSTLYSSKTSMGWYDKKILSFKGIDDLYYKYLPWMHNTSFYTTTFEKLVGPQGGGSHELQVQEIINIAEHLGYSITEERAIQITQTLFGDGITFRKGQIGAWKKHFMPEHKEIFKQVAGQLLIDLGYEKDLNW
ncbi:MAG: hypothetical protein ACE5RI_09745 [Candidatus Nitrosomaritimum yanchengensis]